MVEQRRVLRTPFWRRVARRWLATVICSLALATVVCGLSGFTWQYRASLAIQNGAQQVDPNQPPPSHDWSIPVFKTAQLFLLNSGADDDPDHPGNWLLVVARLSSATLFLVVSSAVIMRVLDDVRRLPGQLTRKNHVVICGLGQIGLQLLDDLSAQGRGKEVVIIENDPANSWLEYAQTLGATIITGDSMKTNTLLEARAPHAREVFIVNGDDGVNVEVTAELGRLGTNRPSREPPLRLYVHVADTNFATVLRPYCQVFHDKPNMIVQVFNVPRTAATRLVTRQLWPFAPKQSHEVAHFVILGFGAMGQALAVQLTQLGHFPNRKRNRLTIADRQIVELAAPFLCRFGRFTSWTDEQHLGVTAFPPEADAWSWNEHPLPDELGTEPSEAIRYACNAEFVELPSSEGDERFAAKLARRFAADGVKPVVIVCGQQDRDNFETAVRLRDQLTCFALPEVPIFVWLPRQPALAEALDRTKDGNFHPFGECHSSASYEEITDSVREAIGRKIYDDHEQESIEAGETRVNQPWSALRDDFREMNRNAADHLFIKLAAIGLTLHRGQEAPRDSFEIAETSSAQAQLLAEMEHYRWVAERLLSGWRYAPAAPTKEEQETNKRRKLNFNLVPWERLGLERKKDFDQVSTVLRECHKDRFWVEALPMCPPTSSGRIQVEHSDTVDS